VKISRAAMKAAQEAAKAAKAPVKGKKNNIFQSYLKASVVKLVLFFIIYLAHFLVISNSYFSEAQNCLPTGLSRYSFQSFVCQKRLSKGFHYYQFYNLFTPWKTLHPHQNL
jgi:hypothetical protein